MTIYLNKYPKTDKYYKKLSQKRQKFETSAPRNKHNIQTADQ